MTQQHDMDKGSAASAELNGPPKLLSRRAVLRGATATVPTILTLHSGAALARSSNLIGAAPAAGPDGNQYRCLDLETVYATDRRGVYDLGDPPMAHVTNISSDRRYYRAEVTGATLRPGDPVTGPQMCAEGGSFLRQRVSGGTYDHVRVKPGVLLSGTAHMSLSGAFHYTDV